MNNNIVEGEIINPKKNNNSTSRIVSKHIQPISFTFITIIAFFISIIPFAGVILSFSVFIWAMLKKYSIVAPAVSLTISLISTLVFVSFVNLVKSIIN